MFRFFLLLVSFLLVFSFKNETNSLILQRINEVNNRIKYLDSILLNNRTVNVIDWHRDLMIYNNGRKKIQEYLQKEAFQSRDMFNEKFKQHFWTGFDNCDEEIMKTTDEDFLKFLVSIQEFIVKFVINFFVGFVGFIVFFIIIWIIITILELYGCIARKTEDELIQELFQPIPNLSDYIPKKTKKSPLFETVKTDETKSYLLEIECSLCRDNMKNATLHCGHCFCHKCILQLKHTCPICLKRFKDFKRIYL